eukprot:104329-Rhodomonas_salina.2
MPSRFRRILSVFCLRAQHAMPSTDTALLWQCSAIKNGSVTVTLPVSSPISCTHTARSVPDIACGATRGMVRLEYRYRR